MDLWVRSQDRESLMKVNRVDKYGLSIVTFDNEYREIYLGRYATEERVLEVLDEINEHIEKQGQTIVITNEKGIADGLKYYGKTYVMPKE